MRTLDVIDAELRLLVVIRRAVREAGGQPSTAAVDELLDERLSALPDQHLSRAERMPVTTPAGRLRDPSARRRLD
jgi:hypothetical protein